MPDNCLHCYYEQLSRYSLLEHSSNSATPPGSQSRVKQPPALTLVQLVQPAP